MYKMRRGPWELPEIALKVDLQYFAKRKRNGSPRRVELMIRRPGLRVARSESRLWQRPKQPQERKTKTYELLLCEEVVSVIVVIVINVVLY